MFYKREKNLSKCRVFRYFTTYLFAIVDSIDYDQRVKCHFKRGRYTFKIATPVCRQNHEKPRKGWMK